MSEPVKRWDHHTVFGANAEILATMMAIRANGRYVLATDHDRVAQELECLNDEIIDHRNYTNAFRKERDTLRAEVERLRELLAPFARVATVFDDDRRGATMVRDGVFMSWPRMDGDYELTVEHLRNARAALSGSKEME